MRRWKVEPGQTPPSMVSFAADVEGEPAGANIGLEVDPDGFDVLELQRDISEATWVAEHMRDREMWGRVAAQVPQVYEAYARVPYSTRSDDFVGAVGSLFDVLHAHTATPEDVWFCLWEGYGGLGAGPDDAIKLTIEVPGRSYYVYRGKLAAWRETTARPLNLVPDLVWPADRAWFLGTDTDLEWGFVGASDACVAELAASGLDVSRVDPRDWLDPAQH